MGIFDDIGAKFGAVKTWVVKQVRWAEAEMKGKTGAEKRAAVVSKLDDLVILPFWLEWLDGPVIGFLVDKICNAMNILTDHGDWDALKATDAEIAAVSELPEVRIKEFAAEHSGADLETRFKAICSEYGITETAGTAAADDKDRITANFKRSEYRCKCGCGKDDISESLVNIVQAIRDKIGEPITINSGVRCAAHNSKVGGVKNSYHTQGLAADLSCKSGAEAIYNAVHSLYNTGAIQKLAFCQLYRKKNFVHVDIGGKRNNVFAVID